MPVWDLTQYAFLGSGPQDDAPDTVNPSLWRMAKLNMIHGLFEVTDGIWQARGYDLSVMSIIRGDSGWIVVDPFISSEVATTVWEKLVVPKLGQRADPGSDLYPQSCRSLCRRSRPHHEADVVSGKVKIIAPEALH